jgi:hypothetical protein
MLGDPKTAGKLVELIREAKAADLLEQQRGIEERKREHMEEMDRGRTVPAERPPMP